MRSRWLGPRALALHLVALVVVPGCGVAAWWQVTIALAGDGLGWLYSIEWPCFGVFAIVVWWNLLHDDPTTTGEAGLVRLRRSAVEPPVLDDAALARAERDDPALAAYNEYLAGLHESPALPPTRPGSS